MKAAVVLSIFISVIAFPAVVTAHETESTIITVDSTNFRFSPSSVTINETESVVNIRWSVSSKFRFTRNQLYDDNQIKKCDDVMLNLPLDKAKSIIKGLMETDGCIGNELTIELTISSIPVCFLTKSTKILYNGCFILAKYSTLLPDFFFIK